MERRAASDFDHKKRALLARLLAREGFERDKPTGITPRTVQGPAPLSFAQRRLWLLEQMGVSGPPAYNMPAAYVLDGELAIAALDEAFRRLLERHEILRTRIVALEGEPRQEVVDGARVAIALGDLTNEEHPADAFAREADAVARMPFDLGTAPLLRVRLSRLGPARHGLAVVLHHLVADGWSLPILMREVMAFYADARRGRHASLPALGLQYADYAVWHRALVEQAETAAHRAFWHREFALPAPPLDLPADHPRPAEQSFHGAEVRYRFDSGLASGLREVGQAAGASLFMTLLACVNVLLYRYSGQRDVTVGSPIAGRDRPELADQIGFYVNMLPLRTTLRPDEPFAALLARVAHKTSEAVEHGIYPFDELVHELHLDRHIGRAPLFDVVLVVEPRGASALELDGLTVRPVDLQRQSSKFDLTLHFVEGDDALDLVAEYSTDLFERPRIVRLVHYLEQIVRSVVGSPHREIGRMPLMPEEERQRVLGWGRARTGATWENGIVQRFEAEARRRPDAIAVTAGSRHLTYGGLNARANRVARGLGARGVGAEVLVGLCLDRSLEMVVAILGVLKAGGAYVPLDPSYPEERLRYLLADSGLQIVLTGGAGAAALRAFWPGIALDLEGGVFDHESGENVSRPVHPDQSAYVIYTSGSTGQPKGCVVTHGNLARLMTATAAWYRFDETDVWTLFHSYAFDFSVWEIWGALASGGRLVIVPFWVSRAPEALLDLLADEGVTVLNQTPSAFRQLVAAGAKSPGALALRHVIFGGEALDIRSLEPWFRTHGDEMPRLVNMYGITETTVHVTCRAIGLVDPASSAGSMIGSPIPDLSLHLLDESFEPVPVGATGEIFVGGAGVCRGYLGRPALTAERFVPDPFSSTPGARLYRSGDLGRWHEQGDIEYLGRADTQVKVRGFRIEVGEIETALRNQAGIDDAVVIARLHAGTQQLVAYVVASDGGFGPVSPLREALARVLPEYMVPAHVVRVESLPLTANGKLDRRALPEPEGLAQASFVPPRTDVEAALCAVWAEALGVSRVGIDDNFFELGGDSILSLRVVAAARTRGLAFGIRELYQQRTIRALASVAAAPHVVADDAALEPFALLSAADRAHLPEDAEDAYPLSRLQAGMFFHSAFDPDAAVFHDIFSYRLGVPFREEALRQALSDVVARHPILRTSFHWDPYSEAVQVVRTGVEVPLAIDDLRTVPVGDHDAAVARSLDAEKRRPFHPSRAPLLRIHLHVRGDDDLQIVASFHHAILDGWSFASLMSELVTGYLDGSGSGSRSDASPGPLPRARFGDFVALEREALRSDEHRQFWSTRVDSLPATRIPRWTEVTLASGVAGHDVNLCAPGEVMAVAQQLGVPVKSICLAAHMRVLALLAGERDVVTGLTTNGRPEGEGGEQVLGLFLNTVPFRLEVGRDSWRTLVERVFDAERELLPHRRFPLSAIKALAGGRELYDAGFNFVQFHVYKAVAERAPVLALTAFEQTDYAFVANFSVDPRDGALGLRLSYDAGQFSLDQVEAIGGYYARALHALASAPDASCLDAALLGEDERHRLLVVLPRGERRDAPPPTLLSRFAEQVRRAPEAPAVLCEGRSISYRELNERSNRVARGLRSRGVGADVLVGLCLPRSEWLLVGLLGTLKAGGAYVPVDLSYPADRISQMLEDSRARVVLSDGSYPGLDVVRLASEGDAHDVARLPDDDQLAYVLYTSGSTGRPKGTMVSHGSLAHYLEWAVVAYNAGAGPSLVHSSVSFDATITSLLAPLIAGQAVELVPEAPAVESLALALAQDRAYSLVKITPAHLDLLRQELGDGGLRARVGVFVIGGEALLESSLAWWRAAAPGSRFVNEYGPTETVVGCAVFEDRGRPGPLSIPIGRPIDRMQLYVLDVDFQPVAIGTAGEIYIGGAGVARGYLDRPALTAGRFLPDPFADEAGTRMYRTGDMGRWRADGDLEYLGRNDSQVKVRGYRVELGEVEAVLSSHPAVSDAAVLARRAGSTHELIAFLVGAAPTLEDIRAFLARRLPEPLIPSRFVVLPALPLTPNGKIDRRALAVLETDSLRPSTTFVSPRTETERALVAIWAEVLHNPRVGVTDDYFAQGGDSLKALQIVSRAARDGWRLRVRDVFDYPTIAGLAPYVRREGAAVERPPVVGDVPLTPIQRWFFDDHAGPYHHFNQAVMLRWRGPVDSRALAAALGALMDHHDALRLRFTRGADGSWQQETAAIGQAVEVVEANGPEHVERLQAIVDLAAGPLVRAATYGGPGADRVLLVIHHLVVDGVSWRVLLDDLDTAYQQSLEGRAVRLPPKTASFQEWAQRVVAYAGSASAAAERPYWEGIVRTPAIAPAADGPAQPGSPERVVVQLDVETTARLLGPAHRAYRTQANDLLLAGLALALEESFGVRRTLLAVEGHGREDMIDLDVARTVGWFTSRYPIQLEIAETDLRLHIRRVKEELRHVPEHGFGYGILRYLAPEGASTTLACRPPIGFNYLGRFDESSTSRAFDVSDEATGAVVDGRWNRDHDLDVVVTVFGGRLDIRMESARGRYRPERIRALADAYLSSLRRIADHCTAKAAEPTPSDLAYQGLDLEVFDALLGGHALTHEAIEDILPLSPMQEGLLFHALYERSEAYFEQSAYRLTGRIDPALFEEAWNRLLDRHPNLRVVFWHEGLPRPVQVVLRSRPVEFLSEDWRAMTPDAQSTRLAAFRALDRSRGFDLASDLLVRVALFRVGDASFDAVWAFPHILLDGWSAGVLLGELLAIYAALVAARPPELSEPVPYRRYLHWLERQDREASAAFWEAYLAGHDETASVPAERRRVEDRSYRAISVPWSLGPDETRRLRQLAARSQVTLNTVVQALWGILLARYTQRDDVVFGATVSGRPETMPGIDRMVGLFINTVPVRVRMRRNDGFVSLARRLQAEVLAGHPHAVLPLADIQSRSAMKSHLFDHILVFENYPLDERLRALGSILKVESSDVFEQVHYDLGLLVADGADRLEMRFIANEAAYPHARLLRVIAHVGELVRSVLADPHRPVREHRVVPEAELRQLARFNETATAPHKALTLLDTLEAQARSTPGAVALIHGRERLTYAELHDRAEQLAGVLRRRGVGPEVLVGVCLNRRPDLIVALLGVLKAGGAYVPLDPAYPADRLAFLFDDARMAMVLTERALRPMLSRDDESVLCIDVPLPAHRAGGEPPAGSVDPDNVAYVIYTSGSTGTPKGTAISHGAAAALVEWARAAYAPDQLRGVLASTSICFDLSVFEIFVTLSTGGAVVLAENALELPQLEANDVVTLVNTVPSAIAELLRTGGIPPSVQTVNLAGEPLLAPLADALYAVPTVRKVYDLYGPSEDTTYSTYALRESGGPETIGRPIANTEIHLLDSQMERVPLGVPGEIYIASDKLCRGYINRPDMTADRFVPQPWGRAPGARMYRTGDLARYREDGSLEFQGRIDHQVKIRGFRIELGEIETVLLQTGWARDVAVIAREDVPGDKQLVAYVVPEDAASATSAGFRERLERTLPAYMVPAVFVFLPHLPLTPNGKLDRRALPRPEAPSSLSIAPPRTELETVLARIWGDVLGVERIGIHDGFFDLGGHSLTATRVISRARQQHGLDVSLRDLFTHPTVAGLADRIASRRHLDRAPIEAVVPAADYALSYGQRRLWVLEQLRGAGPAAYNVPAAFLLHGELDIAALERAFQQVIARHESLRTGFVQIGGEPRQRVLSAIDFRVEVADLSTLEQPEERFDEDARALANAGFDLARAPLIRVAVRKLGPDTHGLAVALHHIVTDGWSIPILIRELLACYRAALSGRPADLPALPIQYKDYAAWQHEQVHGDSAAPHRAYWLAQFAGEVTPLDLPVDFPRPPIQTFDGDRLRHDLDADLAAAVRALADRQGASVFMTLLASVAILLARMSGQDEVTVGSPIAGRTHPSLDDQIGYYVNTVPLRIRVRRGEPFTDLLARLRDLLSAAVEHQAYPFDRLVEDLSVTRDLGRSPLFDVMVAMDTNDDVLAFDGLRVETRPIDYRVSKFDMTVTFHDRGRRAGLGVAFEYSTALFHEDTIRLFGRRLDVLLRAVVARPGDAVGRLPLLPADEWHAVIDRWNWEHVDRPRGRSLATLFEEQVARTPHATAIAHDGAHVSYGELDAWANAIARELLASHGPRPEEPIGLMVDASDRMIAGLLGIMKAGGAYVPLDPGHPLDRNARILDDAGIRVVVASGGLAGFREDVVCLDPSRVVGRDPRRPRANEIDGDERLAYVLYTSGSTGTPKGVAVPHRGVVNLIADCQRRKPIHPGEGCALWTSVSFDVSVYEVFSALLAGGRLHIATETMRTQPRAYFEWLVREQIAHAYVAPFHLGELRAFLETARERPPLSRLLVGVEPIDERLLSSIRALVPGLHVINGYGPTEASICATLYDVPDAPPQRVAPIGRAVANTGAYLLDEELQPVGVGMIGEICLAGDGLARGYHANPAATAEAFVPSPFGPVAGARLYRTGDLGRRLHDGSLVFVGRTDHQVKVRGHRVEIGEVESALRAHPAVADAAVVARATGSTRELIAFLVVTAGADGPSVDALRSFLALRIPDPMLPARYAVVDRLPLTPSGKVDRRALLTRHDVPSLQVEARYVAPRGAREEALAAIWTDVLGVTRVGAHDNYFALGGDSIKAIQIAARASGYGLSIALRDLFEHPTVAALALAAGDHDDTAPQELVVGDAPLTAIQEWFFQGADGHVNHFNQAVLLRWNGPADMDVLRAASTVLLEHHDALRTCYAREASGAWNQRVRATADIAWTAVDLRAQDHPAAVVRMDRLADSLHASLDLEAGRLVAGGLFRLDDGDRVLLVIHHLVVDGVSWRILLEDLDRAYRDLRAGRAPRLSPKTHAFRTWAEAIRRHAEAPATQGERDYWRGVCATAPAPFAPGPAGIEREALHASLDPIDTRSLLTGAHAEHGAEPVHLLLAALAAALRDAFGRPRTLLSLEGHGRESSMVDLDVSRTVGWFTSLYPFVLATGDGPAHDVPLRTTIETVGRSMREVPRKGVGYGLLRYLRGGPDADLACEPDVSFNYLGQFDTDVSTGMFGPASESSGRPVHPDWRHTHALDVSGHVLGGRLRLSFAFDVARLGRAQAERLLEAYVERLRQIASLGGVAADEYRSLLASHGVLERDIEDVCALSPMQEGMLFNAVYDRGSEAYFEQIGYRIRGELDPLRFEAAWNALLVRHANLRVAIWRESASRPFAVVLRDRRVAMTLEDWRESSPGEQRRRLERYRTDDRRRGFDLEQDVLMRFGLFRIASDTWEVVWSHPHVLLDGWSSGILLGELLAIYHGGPEPLPPAVPYTRYLRWIAAQDHLAALGRWRERLAGYEDTASVPQETTAPDAGEQERHVSSWSASSDLTERISAVSGGLGVTVNTMVQAIWGLLLGRLMDRTDVVFGATVSGRPEALPGIEQMVGLFINTLPVRVRWRERDSFADLARRLQDASVSAQSDAVVPLAEIQATAPARAALFDHIVIFENFPLDERLRRLGDGSGPWSIEAVDVFERTHYALALAVAHHDGRLHARLTYDPSRYSAEAIERLWLQWAQLAADLIADPARPVADASVLGSSERFAVVEAFARGANVAETPATLLHLLDARLRLDPDAVAVSLDARQLTQRELHARAERLSIALRSDGVESDGPVAICLDRSLELVVGLLGILKSGGCYLPVDPEYPAARIAFMLEDSRVRVVVTRPGLLADDVVPQVRRLFVDEDGDSIADLSGARPVPLAEQLAYVLYTSGSTGVPKGVAIPHRAIVNHMRWMAGVFPLEPDDRVLQKTSFSFDASVWEFWAPLLEGALLVLAPPGAAQDPRLLVETIRRERITVLQVVPTLLQALLDEPGFRECRGLRRVFAGGEALPFALQQRFFDALPETRLINLYGPTEATIDATSWECRREAIRSAVPIGRPIAGLRAYVLDRTMRPVPIGAWGELFLGGAGIGRGYLHRPDLTAARFVPDPFAERPGARVYRTGDFVRWRADGVLEYRGRADDQVKLRGHRIELGEVEAALRRHPELAEAAVVVSPGGAEMAAYLVARGSRPAPGTLRTELREMGLPTPMIPSRFVFVDELPLTPSGKLDRRALIESDGKTRDLAAEPVRPRDEREAKLAEIWTRVLSVHDVGIHDNFFDLGGHSLTAARAAAQASRDLRVDVSVRDLFTNPTIAGLAAYLSAVDWIAASTPPAEAADPTHEDVTL